MFAKTNPIYLLNSKIDLLLSTCSIPATSSKIIQTYTNRRLPKAGMLEKDQHLRPLILLHDGGCNSSHVDVYEFLIEIEWGLLSIAKAAVQ